MKKSAMKLVFWIMKIKGMGRNGIWQDYPLCISPYCNLEVISYSSFIMPLVSNQPPSSAKSAILLACKSVPILSCDSFRFRPLLCLTCTISVGSSLCSCSFSVIHPFHLFMILLPERSFHKKKIFHSFTDISSMAPITCCINFMFLSIPYKVLYGLASLRPSGVITTTSPFTLGYTILQLSDPSLLKCLWFTKALYQYLNASIAVWHRYIFWFLCWAYSPSRWLHSLQNSRSSCHTQCKHWIIWKTIADTFFQS